MNKKDYLSCLFSKNMIYCANIREKPNTMIYKINYNLWVIVWQYQGSFSIQILNPKMDTRPPIDFKWTKQQTISIIENLIKQESFRGKVEVLKSLATS